MRILKRVVVSPAICPRFLEIAELARSLCHSWATCFIWHTVPGEDEDEDGDDDGTYESVNNTGCHSLSPSSSSSSTVSPLHFHFHYQLLFSNYYFDLQFNWHALWVLNCLHSTQDCLSVRGRSPACLYLITLVWPWSWRPHLDTRPWRKHYEDVDVPSYQNEVRKSKLSKVRARTIQAETQTDSSETITTPHLRLLIKSYAFGILSGYQARYYLCWLTFYVVNAEHWSISDSKFALILFKDD